MYSSIKKTKARPGNWIAILGAGGGLGHMYDLTLNRVLFILLILFYFRGIQIAAKKGLRVLAIDKYVRYTDLSFERLRVAAALLTRHQGRK